MITIDASELGSRRSDLADFLKSKTRAQVTSKGGSLILDLGEETASPRGVKMLVKRFLHQRGLSESYRVLEERRVVRITKLRSKEKPSTKNRGTGASSYNTVPFFFPNPP